MTVTATLTRPPIVAAHWVARLPHRLVLRYVRFRARLRILLRLTKQSKRSVKIAVWLYIGFLVSPLDLVPDFLPFIGVIDEIIVTAIVVWFIKKRDPAVARAIMHVFR